MLGDCVITRTELTVKGSWENKRQTLCESRQGSRAACPTVVQPLPFLSIFRTDRIIAKWQAGKKSYGKLLTPCRWCLTLSAVFRYGCSVLRNNCCFQARNIPNTDEVAWLTSVNMRSLKNTPILPGQPFVSHIQRTLCVLSTDSIESYLFWTWWHAPVVAAPGKRKRRVKKSSR